MTAAIAPELAAEVCQRYGVGQSFAYAYLEYWTQSQGRSFSSLSEIMALPSPLPMWFDFAMSANWRGREMTKAIGIEPGMGRRYLDVGCGFGGYLSAFHELGYEVCGIEIDKQRAEFSRSNMSDCKLSDVVHVIDILGTDAAERLGAFDIITCIDVIEHVLDVDKAIHSITRMLRPGGMLVMEIPNKESLAFVKADGHFGLFGITLLGRESAKEYHSVNFAFPYDVGDYFEIQHYSQLLEREGCTCVAEISPMHPVTSKQIADIDKAINELVRLQDTGEWATTRRVPLTVRREIESALARYLDEVQASHAKGIEDQSMGNFSMRFLADFWLLRATKNEIPLAGIGHAS
jgi:SAM-dependent methyltransferase